MPKRSRPGATDCPALDVGIKCQRDQVGQVAVQPGEVALAEKQNRHVVILPE